MKYKHILPSLEDIVGSRKPVKNPRELRHETLTRSERFTLFIHRRIGSLGFFFLIILWTVAWLGWNMYAPVEYRFDPAPAFVIWLFASNILQLVLLPVIMVGQNIEGRAAERRAQEDFEINQRSEKEISVIIAHQENQNDMLLEIMRKIERS